MLVKALADVRSKSQLLRLSSSSRVGSKASLLSLALPGSSTISSSRIDVPISGSIDLTLVPSNSSLLLSATARITPMVTSPMKAWISPFAGNCFFFLRVFVKAEIAFVITSLVAFAISESPSDTCFCNASCCCFIHLGSFMHSRLFEFFAANRDIKCACLSADHSVLDFSVTIFRNLCPISSQDPVMVACRSSSSVISNSFSVCARHTF
mmetsp:Transcript_161214/g.294451  ORF Transcript_161214/g.294451 Transcript_161214/m.294451 type:complete len:209 (+) Transcript_161214:600-1226(+)